MVGEDDEEMDGHDNGQSKASESTASGTKLSHPTSITRLFPINQYVVDSKNGQTTAGIGDEA